MRNIKLEIEYDGTNFCGWQIQTNVRTVQEELEKALTQLTREKIRVYCAGRTDSGVHALGQIVNFKTESRLPEYVFQVGLNGILSKDIRVINAEEAEDDFNSRFSAKSRTYRYDIITRPVAVGREYAWYFKKKLNMAKMQDASSLIIGSHDFKSFCQAGADVNHYLCDVFEAAWLEIDDKLIFNITANRFLHNMVRILVGTFVKIGTGSINVDDMKHILKAKNRIKAGPTAPPHGLFLVKVFYE
ncbi:tRNA pseudouridine(38-40) synthase TruA [candidate division KSB1 bacterium]|nr:tRNA pseudouridine(38-40) synthase TruA [candidate division KSB1 bacterium]